MYRKLPILLLFFCFSWPLAALAGDAVQSSAAICKQFTDKACSPEQAKLVQQFVGAIDIQSLSDNVEQSFAGNPKAFTALPKDHAGFVNWNKSVTDGIIRPLASLDGSKDVNEGYFSNMMVFETKVDAIPNVIFPHGMHTYWLSCDSCHPKPFKKVRGENDFNMGQIIRGEFCGKCHGKVAFPPGTFKNCNRCHILPKADTGLWKAAPQ